MQAYYLSRLVPPQIPAPPVDDGEDTEIEPAVARATQLTADEAAILLNAIEKHGFATTPELDRKLHTLARSGRP